MSLVIEKVTVTKTVVGNVWDYIIFADDIEYKIQADKSLTLDELKQRIYTIKNQ